MMNQEAAGIWTEGALRPPGGWTAFLAGVAMAALVAVALHGTAARGRDGGPVRDASAPAVREWPEREIPREWRWTPRAVQVDHMFRRAPGTPGR